MLMGQTVLQTILELCKVLQFCLPGPFTELRLGFWACKQQHIKYIVLLKIPASLDSLC